MAYKVFTNGSTLQASELNENLMRQSVAVFSNAAARTAAITSPVEGQLTYLEDVDRYDHWNGTAWRSPFGMTLVNSTTFTSVSSQTINNVFTSAYDDYQILVTLDSTVASGDPTIQLTVGGTATASNYSSIIVQSVVNNPGAYTPVANPSGTDRWRLGIQSSTIPSCSVEMKIYSPNRATRTNFTQLGVGAFGAGNELFMITSAGTQTDTTQFDGFRLNFPGNTSGQVKVYGLRK